MQILSCICDIASLFVEEARDFAFLLRVTADVVFYTLMGCMSAQVTHELDFRAPLSAQVDSSSHSSSHSKNDLVPVQVVLRSFFVDMICVDVVFRQRWWVETTKCSKTTQK